MAKEKQVEKPAVVIPMAQTDIANVIILGAATGLVVWGLGLLFNQFVFDAYLCKNEISSQCANAKDYSAVVALLIGSTLALGGLIRLRVYRPLLVIIASVLSLWGIVQLSWGLDWFIGALIAITLFALAFGLYTWIARIREFWISLGIIIFLVVVARLVFII